MRIIKQGVEPEKAWILRCKCGNCGAELEVTFSDVYKDSSPDQRDPYCYYKYECPCCKVPNDITNSLSEKLQRRVMISKPPKFIQGLQPTET